MNKNPVKKSTPVKKVAKPVAKKQVAPKKATPKKAPVKKVTPKKEVATPAPKASHRKQRGRTAPNRALSDTKKVTVKAVVPKETAKNKKTAPVKWNKVGPKKLPVVKPQPVKKNEPKLPAVLFADQEAELFDLTNPDPMRVKHPELFRPDGSPKPWGSITPPFVPATATISRPTIVPIQLTSSVAPVCKPVVEQKPVVKTTLPGLQMPILRPAAAKSGGWRIVTPIRH